MRQLTDGQMHPSCLNEPPGFPHPVTSLLGSTQCPVNRRLGRLEASGESFRPSEQPERVAFVGRVAAVSEELRQGPDRRQGRYRVLGFQLGFPEVHPAQSFPVRVFDPTRSFDRVRKKGDCLRQLPCS